MSACAQPVQARSERIISLAPNLTEFVYALGAGSDLVGVIAHSDYPKQAQHKPIIGNYQHLDIEKILSLKPTVILSWAAGNPSQQLAILRQFHIPIVDISPQHILQLPAITRKIGRAIGREQQAEVLAQQEQAQLDHFTKDYANKTKIRVFYQIWQHPLITISAKSWLNDALQLCGGTNIFANATTAYPQVNLEQVLSSQPQAIILSSRNKQGAKIWQQWNTPAKHHLILLNPDWISRFGPRLVKGIQQLCQQLNTLRLSKHDTP
ncbi:cobalamin-binding protein [Celerinatantimonas diazotrophica]|uniref:cobalamin-binding protein n=1 Tax=Celerinatantimonas diazotrophica TaxID=412034 RepID=UPI001404AEB0|nr:cobalamin-binding protein [Celerinatantimonas diazotrophica]